MSDTFCIGHIWKVAIDGSAATDLTPSLGSCAGRPDWGESPIPIIAPPTPTPTPPPSPPPTPPPTPTPEPFRYIATGDSIPSGVDLGTSYENDADGRSDASHAYPARLGDRLLTLPSVGGIDLNNTACSGTTTAQYRDTAVCPQSLAGSQNMSQLNYVLSPLGHDPEVITITIGADDYALKLVDQCVLPKLASLDFVGAALCSDQYLRNENSPQNPNNLAAVGNRLKDILGRLTAKYPNSLIVVTNYYNPAPLHLDDGGCAALAGMPGGAALCKVLIVDQINRILADANSLVVDLNLKIASTVAPYISSTGGRVLLADSYPQFTGHCGFTFNFRFGISVAGKQLSVPLNIGCDASQSWIQPRKEFSGSGQGRLGPMTVSLNYQVGVHPNTSGHQCIASVIWNGIKVKLGSPGQVSDPCP